MKAALHPQAYIFFVLSSDPRPSPLQLFLELADQLFRIAFANVCGFALKSVIDAHRNRCVCVREGKCVHQFLSLILIRICFEIIKDYVRITSCFATGFLCFYFANLTCPFLDHTVASLSKCSCSFYSSLIQIFTCFVNAVDYCVTIIWKTPSTSVPVTPVVLIDRFCFWVVPIYRKSFDVSLPSVPTHSVMDMNFPCFTFLFQPLE